MNTQEILSKFNLTTLVNANLSYANLRNADLRNVNLTGANLVNADLRNVNLTGANLRSANLSNAIGLQDNQQATLQKFEFTKSGCLIGYKTFNSSHTSPETWDIKVGQVITENVNPNPTDDCGCGINIATLEWVKKHYSGTIYKLRVSPKDLMQGCVPYNSDGKIRVSRATIIEVM